MRAAVRADTIGGMSENSNRLIIGWFLVLAGAVAALLVVWLGRIVSVPLTTLLTAGAVIIALSWLVVLTTVPWNLCSAARARIRATTWRRCCAGRTRWRRRA